MEHEKLFFVVKKLGGEFREVVKWQFKTKGSALHNRIMALVTMGC